MDCNKTEVYFKEKTRMTGGCAEVNCCAYCPLSIDNNGTKLYCSEFEKEYPTKAIEIVQKWSDEHPIKTYQDVFLEAFPKARIDIVDGVPEVCRRDVFDTPSKYVCGLSGDCRLCWNEEYKEN